VRLVLVDAVPGAKSGRLRVAGWALSDTVPPAVVVEGTGGTGAGAGEGEEVAARPVVRASTTTLVSSVHAMVGDLVAGVDVLDDVTPLGPCTAVPWLETPGEPGAGWYAVAVQLAGAVVPEEVPPRLVGAGAVGAAGAVGGVGDAGRTGSTVRVVWSDGASCQVELPVGGLMT